MPPKKRKAPSVATVDDEQEPSSAIEFKRKLRPRKQPILKLPKKESKKFTIKKPYPQYFNFPENLVYYIARNPINARCHRNVIKTCKLLFRMSRIIPADHVRCFDYSTKIELMDESFNSTYLTYENFSMFKLWMSHLLHIENSENISLASKLTKNINKCSLQILRLYKQVLTFAELQLLTGGGSLEKVDFTEIIVKNDDGCITEYEKVFEASFCNYMDISLHSDQHGICNTTTSRIIELLRPERKSRKSRTFKLRNIPQTFDFQLFSDFLKENMVNRRRTIDLEFCDKLSDDYRNQVQQFVNEIIQIPNLRGRAVPLINLTGENDETYKQLRDMRHQRN